MYYSKKIKDVMKDWKKEAGVTNIVLYRLSIIKDETKGTIHRLVICTNRPGLFIGKMGSLVDKYRQILTQLFDMRVDIVFEETDELI